MQPQYTPYFEPAKLCIKCRQLLSPTEFTRSAARKDGLSSYCKACVKTRQQAVYKAKHPSKDKANPHQSWRERYQKDPDFRAKALMHKQTRRARKAGNGGSYTLKEWQGLCVRYGNVCLCCGEARPLTPDHIIPIAKGGTSNIDNIQPLCRECNAHKHTKIIDYRR